MRGIKSDRYCNNYTYYYCFSIYYSINFIFIEDKYKIFRKIFWSATA